MLGRKSKKFKAQREALKKQVEWCKMVALDYYIAGDAYMCNVWTGEAAKVQDRILRMYPRFQKPIKTKKTVFVPVYMPSGKAIEVAE